ncbi:MAG: hypothetical protein U9R25_14880 [Chloroflexota bacterium]|nr:hypothetical protein [Chloroflexota bacterium]
MYRKTIILLMAVALMAATSLLSLPVHSQTTLSAGDIAIVGANFDNPDEFAFMLLENVSAGTEIKFTDRGWTAAGSFRPGEGVIIWTASFNRQAGEVVLFTDPPSGEFGEEGSFALSSTGDQILAYMGPDDAALFLYGFNSQDTGWQPDATSSNESALPAGLVEGTTAVALDEIDNAVWNCNAASLVNAVLASVGDPANWTGSNTERQAMPVTELCVSLPLAVTLTSFTASARADHVLVAWETLSELNNAGFNLYRSATPEAPETLLATVPSQAPGGSQGATYQFQDFDVIPGQTYWYWLESIAVTGAMTLHGPVSVLFQAPAAVTLGGFQADQSNPSPGTRWLPVLIGLMLFSAVGWPVAGRALERRL